MIFWMSIGIILLSSCLFGFFVFNLGQSFYGNINIWIYSRLVYC